MLTRERRPNFRTTEKWATGILLEAGAIHECDHHGWAKDRTDPHAREEALRVAGEDPPLGMSPEAAVCVLNVLELVGDSCPECS
jgi:hypothetical protein